MLIFQSWPQLPLQWQDGDIPDDGEVVACSMGSSVFLFPFNAVRLLNFTTSMVHPLIPVLEDPAIDAIWLQFNTLYPLCWGVHLPSFA